ncbi:MAG: D-alanyl-D-alanine endopeptidase [Pseudomonadales bacterium]|nr:D-alanyl-D-alanine endopeptidase [Pseudomonadales bacterium]
MRLPTIFVFHATLQSISNSTIKSFVLLLCLSSIFYSLHTQAQIPSVTKQSFNAKLDRSKIQLGSVHAAVVDIEQQGTLYSKNADITVPIASITKLMTAVVVLESNQPLNEYIVVNKRQNQSNKNAYSRIRLESKLSRGNLLRLALMSSENLSATVLASNYSGGHKQFIKAMNQKAKELEMHNTQFVDANGLSPKNISTAADLARLATAASTYQQIRMYSTTPTYTANFKNPRYRLGYSNTNPLVHRDNWNILITKTGYIHEAGRCLVMVANIEGRSIAFVLLNSFGKRTPIGDAGRVKRWLTTGSSGPIIGAALKYEQEKLKQL